MSDTSSDATSKTMRDQDRQRLLEHFSKIAPEQQANAWDKMWEEKVTPWDRGIPSPALVDTLKEKVDILGSPFREAKPGDLTQPPRKKALVPGCGKGYDVFLLAASGYDAYGLDNSQIAVDGARESAKAPNQNAKYPLRNGLEGRGEVKFVLADFFKDDFFSETEGGQFDVIFDYTFLCALPPALRPKWAKRMSELLSPTGRLICLEYPLQKAPNKGGPPHGLTAELYEELLKNPGREVRYNPGGYVCEIRSDERAENALIRLARWKAERTHAESEHVSIWRHMRK